MRIRRICEYCSRDSATLRGAFTCVVCTHSYRGRLLNCCWCFRGTGGLVRILKNGVSVTQNPPPPKTTQEASLVGKTGAFRVPFQIGCRHGWRWCCSLRVPIGNTPSLRRTIWCCSVRTARTPNAELGFAHERQLPTCYCSGTEVEAEVRAYVRTRTHTLAINGSTGRVFRRLRFYKGAHESRSRPAPLLSPDI